MKQSSVPVLCGFWRTGPLALGCPMTGGGNLQPSPFPAPSQPTQGLFCGLHSVIGSYMDLQIELKVFLDSCTEDTDIPALPQEHD